MNKLSKRILAVVLCIAVALSFESAALSNAEVAYAEEPVPAVTVEMGNIYGMIEKQTALISWDAATVTITDETGDAIPDEEYEISYHVLRKEGAAKYEEVSATENLQYKDGNIKEETKYRYKVSCTVSFSGEQSVSETEPTQGLFYLKKVSKPVDLKIKQKKALKKYLSVSWDRAQNAQKYEVYRKTGSGNWKLIRTTSERSFTDKTTAFKKKYRYKIKAYRVFSDTRSESAFSDVKACKVKLPRVSKPRNVRIRQKNRNKSALTISWKKAKNARRYMVYRKKGSGKWRLVKTTSKRTFVDKKTEFNKRYRYKVKAYGIFDGVKSRSAFSKTKRFKVKIPQVFNIKVKNINQYKIGYNMGCEIVSLAILLRFMGFTPKKGKSMCDLLYYKLTRKGDNDLRTKYYGNPHGNGSYGACYETVIRNTALNFFEYKKTKHKVKAYKGKSLDYLLKHIWHGRPVIIWVTEKMQNSRNYSMSGGIWNVNAHTLVLTGYNKKKGLVYVADPERGNVKYRLSTFRDRYALRGKRAVVIY